MQPIYFVKDSEYTFRVARPQPCLECGNYERRYEDLLDVHGETLKQLEEAKAGLRLALGRLKWVSEDSESAGFIASCQPVVQKIEELLNRK